METFFDTLIEYFYYDGDLLKSFIAFFGFSLLLLVILEGFYIIKSATKNMF